MKNMKQLILGCFAIFCFIFYENSVAQVTTGLNNGIVGDYVGWDGTMGIPLDIRTTNANNIDFFTDSVLRMNLIGNAF